MRGFPAKLNIKKQSSGGVEVCAVTAGNLRPSFAMLNHNWRGSAFATGIGESLLCAAQLSLPLIPSMNRLPAPAPAPAHALHYPHSPTPSSSPIPIQVSESLPWRSQSQSSKSMKFVAMSSAFDSFRGFSCPHLARRRYSCCDHFELPRSESLLPLL